MPVFRIATESTFQHVDLAMALISEFFTTECCITDKNRLFIICFALRELLNNAVEHGNRMERKKKVKCFISFDCGSIEARIADEGEGFCIREPEEAQCSKELDGLRHRGLYLIMKLGFDIKVNCSEVTVKADISKLGYGRDFYEGVN
ncbi:MAG: ATP-binding protein [Clostridia bacterium]|nr:ATP-binding protein [Clostridia bacterium]